MRWSSTAGKRSSGSAFGRPRARMRAARWTSCTTDWRQAACSASSPSWIPPRASLIGLFGERDETLLTSASATRANITPPFEVISGVAAGPTPRTRSSFIETRPNVVAEDSSRWQLWQLSSTMLVMTMPRLKRLPSKVKMRAGRESQQGPCLCRRLRHPQDGGLVAENRRPFTNSGT
jgi:hypothetical protein